MNKSELLLPAGSLVKLKTALMYGADAVYAGTPDMSLRTQSAFSLEDLSEGIELVHKQGKKIYLTLNLYIHNEEAEKLPHFIDTLRQLKPDGVLVADPGVFYYLKENAPELNRFGKRALNGKYRLVPPVFQYRGRYQQLRNENFAVPKYRIRIQYLD